MMLVPMHVRSGSNSMWIQDDDRLPTFWHTWLIRDSIGYTSTRLTWRCSLPTCLITRQIQLCPFWKLIYIMDYTFLYVVILIRRIITFFSPLWANIIVAQLIQPLYLQPSTVGLRVIDCVIIIWTSVHPSPVNCQPIPPPTPPLTTHASCRNNYFAVTFRNEWPYVPPSPRCTA